MKKLKPEDRRVQTKVMMDRAIKKRILAESRRENLSMSRWIEYLAIKELNEAALQRPLK